MLYSLVVLIKDGEKIENVVPSVWIQNKIVFYPSVFNKIRGCVSKKMFNIQCRIQEKIGDSVFSWGSGLPCSIPTKVCWFKIFCPLLVTSFFAVKDFILNRTQESSLFTLAIYQETTIFLFSSSFLGTSFWAPISFECFQCGCNPVMSKTALSFLVYELNS